MERILALGGLMNFLEDVTSLVLGVELVVEV